MERDTEIQTTTKSVYQPKRKKIEKLIVDERNISELDLN
jgi:capsid portal protein